MNPFLLDGQALREPWRLFTCHFVHWDWGHALRDALALLAPFLLWPRRGRLAVVLLLAAPLLSLTLLPVLRGGSYGGASGLAAAAWAYVGLGLLRMRRPAPGLLLLGLLAAKVLLEGLTPQALFESSPGWQSLPAAHLHGALLGILAAALETAAGRPTPSS